VVGHEATGLFHRCENPVTLELMHAMAIRQAFRSGVQPGAIADAFNCEVSMVEQLCIGVVASWPVLDAVPPELLPAPTPKAKPGKPLAIPQRCASELRSMVEAGATTTELARYFGVNESTVGKATRRFGIERSRCLVTDAAALRALIDQGLTYDEIVVALGVSKTSVASAVKRFGLPRPRLPVPTRTPEVVDFDRLAELVRSGMTDRDIAAEFGVNADKVRGWRKRFSLPKNPRPMPVPAEVATYIARGETYGELADRFGVSRATVRNIIARNALPSPRLLIQQPSRSQS
jgi:transposase-like protein